MAGMSGVPHSFMARSSSSTRMPIAKISANSETRLSVKPHAQEANSVAASVITTAAPTMTASRQLIASQTKGKKLYGHLYDDLLKLKYLHQRYTNYLAWLRAQ